MSIETFLGRINAYILNPVIALLFAVSTIYFFYGIVRFLSAGSEQVDKTRKEAQNAILWGLVGMVIMFSVFGLIRFVLGTFGVSTTGPGAGYILR
jgi:uncharacterized membrane protein